MIKLSTLESVRTELSVFRMASLKVRMMPEFTATFLDELTGLNVTLGVIESIAVKVAELALLAFPELSSTIAPMAT